MEHDFTKSKYRRKYRKGNKEPNEEAAETENRGNISQNHWESNKHIDTEP